MYMYTNIFSFWGMCMSFQTIPSVLVSVCSGLSARRNRR